MSRNREPDCFGAEHVAAFLDAMDRPGYAQLVRIMDSTGRAANMREAALIRRVNELVDKYEPKPVVVEGATWTGD